MKEIVTCQGGVVGVDSSLRDGGVLQGLPRLDLLLQTIVNLVVSHFALCLQPQFHFE